MQPDVDMHEQSWGMSEPMFRQASGRRRPPALGTAVIMILPSIGFFLNPARSEDGAPQGSTLSSHGRSDLGGAPAAQQQQDAEEGEEEQVQPQQQPQQGATARKWPGRGFGGPKDRERWAAKAAEDAQQRAAAVAKADQQRAEIAGSPGRFGRRGRLFGRPGRCCRPGGS